MVKKFGTSFWDAGNRVERAAITENAEALEWLQGVVERQGEDIVKLRALVTGLVELLQVKLGIDDAELESSVNAALREIAPPPRTPRSRAGDPYRDLPAGDATAEDTAAAKALLAEAQDHHFAKRFAEARAVYEKIVDSYPATKQAAVARQQLDNLD